MGGHVHYADIKEKLYPISFINENEYVTKSGCFYKHLHDDIYYQKTPFQNKHNEYMYVSLTKSNGKQTQRRVNVILGRMFILNPKPNEYKVVGHLDNIKWHNNLDNLYWTSNQENTQKAVDDGLLVNSSGVEDSQSICIAVYTVDTNELVSVYGSISICSNHVENSSKSYIANICQKDYKPRGKIYKYVACSKEFYYEHIDIRDKKLVDLKNSKKPSRFVMSNQYGIRIILDNQKQAERITGIKQATISKLIKNNSSLNGWSFHFIEKIEYKDSSSYKNFRKKIDGYLARNINTNEVKIFDSYKEVKEYFNLKGHDPTDYLNGHILLGQWTLIKIDKNNNLEIEVA